MMPPMAKVVTPAFSWLPNSVINSMMEETGSIGKEEKNTYRAMTELFYSVAASFLEAEGVSSRYLCDEGDSMQVRIVGVPISGMTDRDDEVEVRNLRWEHPAEYWGSSLKALLRYS
ncbi:hypothetical protein CPMB20_00680 [Corynebacterium pseudotuberculosis]|nr:hypothetical protein CPMB20_00680 [Corynebacterium pseudotuberculosis]